VPVLEVYAPLREQGTGRIIAAAETYEIANDLRREMFVSQLMTWLAIGAVTLIIVVLMFSMANSGGIERHSLIRRIAELTRLRAESEARRQRVSHANLHVSEMNERSMDRVRTALHEGPAQFVALALLKFDSLDRLICRAKNGAPPTDEQALEDLETIRKALNETLRHIRGVSTTLLPSDIEEMSVGDTLARAVRRHERRTGVEVQYVADGLLQQLPFPVKACLYRFVLEGLESMAENGGAAGQAMRASFDGEKIVLAITSPCPEVGTPRPISSSDIRALRDRVEAVGGSFSFRSSPHEGVSLLAEFTFSEVNRD
jgi:signal transduction histidine kinase